MNAGVLRRCLVFAGALVACLLAAPADHGAQAQMRWKGKFRVDCPVTVMGIRNITSLHAGWQYQAQPASRWRLEDQITGPNIPTPAHYKLICRYNWKIGQGNGLALTKIVRASTCEKANNGWDCTR